MSKHMRAVQVDTSITCPFCEVGDLTSEEMEKHVHTTHASELSPLPKIPRRQVTAEQNINSKTNPGTSYQPGSSGLRGQFTSNLKIQESSKTSLIQCPYCEELVVDDSALQLHFQFGHDNVLPPAPLNITPSQFMCPICNANFDNLDSLESHAQTHFESETDLAGGNRSATTVNSSLDLLARKSNSLENLRIHQNEEKSQVKLHHSSSLENLDSPSRKSRTDDFTTSQSSITDFFTREKGKDLSIRFGYKDDGLDDGNTCTRHLVLRLDRYLNHRSDVPHVWLSNDTEHFSHSMFDRGWGCGYRNIQMMLSCLLKNPTYETLLSENLQGMPSVAKLQQLIETAWEAGFDPAGKEQLNGKLKGTKKWIGATEVVAMLSWMRIKCSLIDFHRPTGREVKHPCLIEWVKDYYQNTDQVFKPPIYLQHQGHSRTIIGLEQFLDGKNVLLIFDPSTAKRQLKELATASLNDVLMSNLRVLDTELTAHQYQIVAVTGIIDPGEIESYKLLKSERKP